MMKTIALWTFLLLRQFECNCGFQFSTKYVTRRRCNNPARKSVHVMKVVDNDNELMLDKAQRIIQTFPPFDEIFDANLKSIFPNALPNSDLQWRVLTALAEHGCRTDNTLLATSLCSDELARRLEDDFVQIFGNNFSLGGLAGFPFAGNIGFQTMTGHIPDGGFCLLVYGPHVGVTADGVIGSVERKGVVNNDICCTSAIKACYSVLDPATRDGGGTMDALDLQQSAVVNLLRPIEEQLQSIDQSSLMLELPYVMYDIQTQLIQEIVQEGIGGAKEGGIALLGGVQINTGPDTLDYFHPQYFSLINNLGELVEDMLPKLVS